MNITNAKTAILAADQLRASKTVIIQNTGSVGVSLGIGSENIASLTYANGVLLEAGDRMELSGNDAAQPVSGITETNASSVRANTI